MRSAILLMSLCILACAPPTPTAKEIQSAKAEAAAESIHFDENAEIDNIKRRLELTSSPGLLGYVVLLNDAGQPIQYTAVKGKITSGSKRLTSPYLSTGSGYVPMAASDEGTYGSSNDYVYFWTESGQYIQWNGRYLYSDKPFRLRVEPLVVEVTPAL
jgi:hypothetical protein